MDAPRFHHQWKPDKITMERGFSPDTIRLLQERGHQVESIPALARIFAIVVERRTGCKAPPTDAATGRPRRILNRQSNEARSYQHTCSLITGLTSVWLDRIWDAGVPAVEIFCAKQHLDWRDRGQVGELGHWFRDSELKLHSLHSPMYDDEVWGRSGPQAALNITEPLKAKRIAHR